MSLPAPVRYAGRPFNVHNNHVYARRVMNVQSRHWLDYDPVALVVLVVAMSAVALLALSI